MPNDQYYDLLRFIEHDMRMQAVYQPVLLRTLLQNNGTASRSTIAEQIRIQDNNRMGTQIRYEQIVRNLPGQVLTDRGWISYDNHSDQYKLFLNIDTLSDVETAALISACRSRIENYRPDTTQINRKYYALFVNPRIYDIDQAIQNVTRDLWVVPPRRGEIYSGDRVIICRGMKDGHRGIVAFGEVVGNSRETADIGNVYWNDSSDSEVIRSRVPIEFRPLSNGPLWTDQHPMLEDLSVFRSTGGSKFNVTSDQWEQIIEIAGGWPDSSNGSNSMPPVSIVTEDQEDFDPSNLEDQRAREYRKIVIRLGQPRFRRELLDAYQNKCAVTGYDVPEALEAAHIYRYQGPETNYVSNGLVLRSDIHALFDRYLLTIDSDSMTIVIHQDLEHTNYANLSGVPITIPINVQLQPNKAALDQHRALSGL